MVFLRDIIIIEHIPVRNGSISIEERVAVLGSVDRRGVVSLFRVPLGSVVVVGTDVYNVHQVDDGRNIVVD